MRPSVAPHNLCIQWIHEGPSHDALVRSARLLGDILCGSFLSRCLPRDGRSPRQDHHALCSMALRLLPSTPPCRLRAFASSQVKLEDGVVRFRSRLVSILGPGPSPLLELRHAQMKRPMLMVSRTEIARVSVRLVTHAFREGLRDWLADPGLARDQDKDPRRAWPAPYRRKRSSIPCRQQPAWSSHAVPQTGSACRSRPGPATRVHSRISDVSPRDLKNCCSPREKPG